MFINLRIMMQPVAFLAQRGKRPIWILPRLAPADVVFVMDVQRFLGVSAETTLKVVALHNLQSAFLPSWIKAFLAVFFLVCSHIFTSENSIQQPPLKKAISEPSGCWIEFSEYGLSWFVCVFFKSRSFDVLFLPHPPRVVNRELLLGRVVGGRLNPILQRD